MPAVIVTHNLAQARRIADVVAVFRAEDGPAKEVFASPQDPIAAGYLAGG